MHTPLAGHLLFIASTRRHGGLAALVSFALIATLIMSFNVEPALGFSFGASQNLSNTSATSAGPKLAVSGSNVYVVWQDGSPEEIFFKRSTNNGTSFDSSINISSSPILFSGSPTIAASGNNVYVIWQENSPPDIFFAKSTDSGATFGTPVNLSSTGTESSAPKIVALDDNVYVIWDEDLSGGTSGVNILFRGSTDSGATFGSAITLGADTVSTPSGAEVTALDNEVYIIWPDSDSTNTDLIFAKSTDSGNSFASTLNLSAGTGSRNVQSPRISVSGGNVYAAWWDIAGNYVNFTASTNDGTTFASPSRIATQSSFPAVTSSDSNVYLAWQNDQSGSRDIFFAKSTSSGSTFGSPINVSNTGSTTSSNARIAVSGSNVYMVWQENSPNDIFFAASIDGGSTFGSSVNLSNNAGSSDVPELTINDTGSNAYVVWRDQTPGNADVFFMGIADSGQPLIVIQSIGDSTPRWGIDSVSVSGTVGGNGTDTITIEWGDGTSNGGIAVSGSSWGPVTHTYGAANTGARDIVAKLLDSSSNLKASDTESVSVQKHTTSVTIDDIFSVVQGSSISVTGTLTDTDASAALASKTITFTGTGAAGLSSSSTSGAGTYSASGASPNSASDLLSVTAHFTGDTSYLASDSQTESYDTVASGTAQFNIQTGTPSPAVTLTGFNASIAFDSVLANGVIYVSTCDAPSSSRYVEVDGMCLKISPAVSLAADSAAHITMSYGSLPIPSGYSESDVDLFHEKLSGIVDVTESRNTGSNTVTGKVTNFSKIIGGAAVHSAVPTGGSRQQLYVGDNDLLFDFPAVGSISIGDVRIGSPATVTADDAYATLDNLIAETVSATITSTSDSTGITITLAETGANTGIFTGSFTPVIGPSSSTAALLHVNPGESVIASYRAVDRASFKILVEGVVESGMLEVVAAEPRDDFSLVSDVYLARLIDAQLGSGANATVTMSYENVNVDFDPLQLKMYRFDGLTCEQEIAYAGTSGIDASAKTVKGNTTTIGQYTLSLLAGSGPDVCPPESGGGAGGGLPRPGTGIVLDFVAPVRSSSGGSGGGGSGSSGGGSSALGSAQQPTLSEPHQADKKMSIDGKTISARFESINSDGDLHVAVQDVSQAGIFDKILPSLSGSRGVVGIGGSTFSTAGDLFEIDASDISFEGSVEITIPYNESMAASESSVRLLHYDKENDEWEDATISIDTEDNTVTGMVDSLSPVVAASVDDGTFGDAYFEHNPAGKILVNAPNIGARTGEQVSIQAGLKNLQRQDQDYVFLVQVVDEKGVAQSITWQKGSISQGQNIGVSVSWNAELAGNYRVSVFVWDRLDDPAALSNTIYIPANIR